ncbi:MAG TPA: class I SAM-dependent methyltransferase [Burkholderiales bacterium]|nr:class I SAM-dependent methyltransferase [Burkholderiales bacterium]
MAEYHFDFDDSPAYERAIGRWSRAVAPVFLQWLAPPVNARWLDVGCGTGILVHTLLELCSPAAVTGVDSAVAQVGQASRGPAGGRASFEVGDARSLPFRDASFDIVTSALVLNFIPEQQQALAEMRRVARTGGTVAAYVWDFEEELSPSGPLRRAMRRFGLQVPPIPGTVESRLEMLRALFKEAGLERIETRIIDVCLAYKDFDDFWKAQTPSYVPTTKVIASMTESDRTRLMRAVRDQLPTAPEGVIEYFARANAIKARVPRGVRARH